MLKPKKYRYWTGTEMLHNIGVHPFLMIRHEKDLDDQKPNDKFLDNNEEGCLTTTPGDNLTEFIGLYDRDWNEIYEADIVSGTYKGKEFTGTVKWQQQGCCFYIELHQGAYLDIRDLGAYGDERGISLSNISVIGNTFMNRLTIRKELEFVKKINIGS